MTHFGCFVLHEVMTLVYDARNADNLTETHSEIGLVSFWCEWPCSTLDRLFPCCKAGSTAVSTWMANCDKVAGAKLHSIITAIFYWIEPFALSLDRTAYWMCVWKTKALKKNTFFFFFWPENRIENLSTSRVHFLSGRTFSGTNRLFRNIIKLCCSRAIQWLLRLLSGKLVSLNNGSFLCPLFL